MNYKFFLIVVIFIMLVSGSLHLGYSMVLFGSRVLVARSFSLFFSILTVFLIYFLALKLFEKDHRKETIALLACFLYIIDPLMLQGSLLVDFDGSFQLFLIMLFIYVFVSRDLSKNINLLTLGVIFSLALLEKLSVVATVFFFILSYNLLKGLNFKHIYRSLIIFIVGICVFLVSLLLYTHAVGISFTTPLEHSSAFIRLFSVGKDISFTEYLLEVFYWGIKNTIFWITPFFALLVFISIFVKEKPFWINVLLSYSFLVFFWSLLSRPAAWGFPKYYLPMIPAFCIVVAYLLVRENILYALKNKFCLFTGLLLFIYYAFVLKDPFIINYGDITARVIDMIRSVILYAVPFALFSLYLILEKKKKVLEVLLTSGIVFTITTSVYIDVLQGSTDYSTIYAYGKIGTSETAEFIRENTPDDAILISPKDVAYYSNRRFYEIEEVYNKPDEFEELSEKADYIVSCDGYFCQPNTEVEKIISEFHLIKEIGSYNIYATR